MASDESHSEAIDASDSHTTLAELRKLVDDFVSERDWHQFHAPKNLVMALSVEASELMEHFQWITAEQSRSIDDAHTRQLVCEEMADVLAYLVALANQLDVRSQ